MEREREIPIRRILVALDASPSSLVALRAAAELASALDIELSGLFVEDVNLLRAAELPSARVLGSFSGRPLPLERRGIERGLRAEARRAREAQAAVAERGLLRWSFRVARDGPPGDTCGGPGGKPGRCGQGWLVGDSPWFDGQDGRRRHAGISPDRRARSPTIVVLYDGSETSERALDLAADLARKRDIAVLVQADASHDGRSLVARAVRGLEQHGMSARCDELPPRACELARVVNCE